jgi:hypothetical protein
MHHFTTGRFRLLRQLGCMGWLSLLVVVMSATVPQSSAAAPASVEGFWAVFQDRSTVNLGLLHGLNDNRTFTGAEHDFLASQAAATVTSTSATQVTEPFALLADFTGFACCSGVGLGSDNPRQSASFHSTLRGLGSIADDHTCDLPSASLGKPYVGLSEGYNYSPSTCGILAQDFSASYLELSALGAWQAEASFFTMAASVQFSEVPEPSVLTILSPAVLGLGLLRRGPRTRSA